jgi:hypothetical protein
MAIEEVATMHESGILGQPVEGTNLEQEMRAQSELNAKALTTALTSGPRPWGARA